MKIKPWRETLQEEIVDRQELLDLGTRIEDLDWSNDRWNNKYWYSKSVNSLCTDIEISHSCGCCRDSRLQVRPYAIIDGRRIFSDPVVFGIGEKNECGIGDRPDSNWFMKLRESKIPENTIIKIGKYFDDNPPIDIEDDDEY